MYYKFQSRNKIRVIRNKNSMCIEGIDRITLLFRRSPRRKKELSLISNNADTLKKKKEKSFPIKFFFQFTFLPL